MAVLAKLCDGWLLKETAKAIGPTPETLRAWRKKDPAFGAQVKSLLRPAAFSSQGIGGGVLSRAAKPRRKNRVRPKRSCLACQNDESGLGDFFRQRGVTKLAQSDRKNQVDMP